MKKLILMLLVLTGGVLQVSATDYYVIGTPAGGWVGNPISASPSKALKMNTSDNVTYYYDITSSNTEYFAIVDGEGSNADDWSGLKSHRFAQNASTDYAVDGDEYGISVEKGRDKSFYFTGDGSTYRIVFNASTKKVSFVKQLDLVVAGCYNTDDNASFFGTAWSNSSSSNVMTIQDDGTYAKSYSNVPMTETGDIIFKVVKKGAWSPGSSKNLTKAISTKYTYDIKFTVKVGDYDNATCTTTESEVSNYYIVGGLDDGSDWTLSTTPMSKSGDVHSTTLTTPATSSYAYRFAIVPNTVISGGNVFNWNRIVRPSTGNTTDWWLGFTNISNYDTTTDTSKGNAWRVTTDMSDCSFTITYSDFKWSCAPYFTRTINSAESNGSYYATFSSTHNVAIPAGMEAYYAQTSQTTEGRISLTAFANGIYAGEGAFLKTSGSSVEYTFTPAASTDHSDTDSNLLKAGLSTGVPASTDGSYNYVFANTSGLGFYKVTSDLDVDMTGKAYLHSSTELSARLAFDFDGEDVTGISNVKNATSKSETYFNLAGQRIANPTKGLYIVNGKKVIVK